MTTFEIISIFLAVSSLLVSVAAIIFAERRNAKK